MQTSGKGRSGAKADAEKYFEIVDIARITESYPKLTLDFYLISCYKPKI